MTCIADDSDAVLTWKEQGGPAIAAPTGPAGFWSQLVAKSLGSQLGGTIAFDWAAEGVIITLRMNKARLGRCGVCSDRLNEKLAAEGGEPRIAISTGSGNWNFGLTAPFLVCPAPECFQ